MPSKPRKSSPSSAEKSKWDELIRLTTPRLNRYIPHRPHPRQAAFLLDSREEMLFGGAVGGGKSDALLMAALQYFDIPGYAALILRTSRLALALPDGLIPRSHEWLTHTGATWNGTDKQWTSAEGATLTFGYLESEGDRYRYASSAYQFIAFEELTEFRREEDYRFLFSRLRKPAAGPLVNVPLRMRASTNPIGPGYAWVKRRFVDAGNAPMRAFLPSRLEDNPSLDAEAYEKALAQLPPLIAEKLRHGDWSAVEKGQVFDRAAFHFQDLLSAPAFTRVVRFWDLAASEPSDAYPDPDWTCGVKMALDVSGRPWTLDVKMARLGPERIEQLVLRTANEDGKAVPVRMFTDPGQAGKAQVNTFARLLAGYDFGGVPIGGNKWTLAQPYAAQVRNRRAIWSATGSSVGEALDQLEGFPTAVHDDAVDGHSGAYNWLVSPESERAQQARDYFNALIGDK